MSGSMKGSGDFSIGSKVWPGTSKLIEESGELQQVLGKLIAIAGETDHWNGPLRPRLVEEMGDVMAALSFFEEKNLTVYEREELGRRAEKKLALFRRWHTEQRTAEQVPPEIKTKWDPETFAAGRGNKILHLPFRGRVRSIVESHELDAATEWLLTELGEPVSLIGLRALAKKELKRPRDATHKGWAKCFLKETEGYTKEIEEKEP